MEKERKIMIGDLVWAKMKGYPWWPGMVTQPGPNMQRIKTKLIKPHHCVYFFGSHNFAWIDHNNVVCYEEGKKTFEFACKSVHFKDACAEITVHIKRQGIEEILENSNDKSQSSSEESNNVQSSSKASPRFKITRVPKVYASRTGRSSNKSTGLLQKVATVHTAGISESATCSTSSVDKVDPVDTSASKEDADEGTACVQQMEEYDLTNVSIPNDACFGFIGLGNMGREIVKKLIKSGINVIVWNRSAEKCAKFVSEGAAQGKSPADVVQSSVVTFSCVSDAIAVDEILNKDDGVVSGMTPGKGYVEMTTVDPETSARTATVIESKGGRYMEAQLQGSIKDVEEGNLTIVASGSHSVFQMSQSVFCAIAKKLFSVGRNAGQATKVNTILEMMKGACLASFAEGMALADMAGIQRKDMLEIVGATSLSSALLMDKGSNMVELNFPPGGYQLQNVRQSLSTALIWSSHLEKKLNMATAALALYQQVEKFGYGSDDASAIYVGQFFKCVDRN